ncbi:MAG: hypothetical protein EOO73_03635 [Myxococcales bacterium]|nr:MAG: hypothetical protein EOO73_03635 [Myxococcales bacterium]
MRSRLVALGLSAALLAPRARALEPGNLAGEPLRVDVTESSSVYYNFDNRDSKPNQVATRANDDFGLVYNRLSAQATRGNFSLGARVDNVWFYASPNAARLALDLTSESSRENAPGYFRSKLDEAGLELSNRFIDWVYPSKYYLTYSRPGVEATLGDASAQLGRGIVLSVRKRDELGSDTTIRGARLTLTRSGPLGLKLTALGGELNPLRIDEASGRYLGVFGGRDALSTLTEAGMPRAIATDFAPLTSDCQTSATCGYAPDRIAAGQLELSGERWKLATQGSALFRDAPLSEDVVRSAGRVLTLSESFEVTRVLPDLSLYGELAFQHLGDRGQTTRIDPGYGFYGSASYTPKGVALTLEARHYRRLFPLSGNVKLSRAREFSSLAYNQVPTTEPEDNDTEFERMNTCVTGGRLRGDFTLRRGVRALGSASHYVTYAESGANEACRTSAEQLNRVYDVSSGFALDSRDRRRHAEVVLGGRLDRAERELVLPSGSVSHLFYTEGYLRHVFELPLSEAFSVSLTGRHRRRAQAEGGPGVPWSEGEEVLGLEWAEHSSIGLGAEYDTRPGVPHRYFNVEISHRPTPATRVALFAGQRRGALRCVGGICRLYPPFEGVRLDVALRF